MSDDVLTIAIEAAAAAKEAHRRLDRMNGSIDRLGREVGDLRGDISSCRAEATANHEAVLRRLDRQAGIEEGAGHVRKSFLDSRWRVFGLAGTILGSGVFAALVTYLIRS